jgi:hypothetical protein
MSAPQAIDIAAKFAAFDDHWRPRIAAQANGQDGMKPLASPATSMTRFPAWSADQSANEHAKSGSPGRPFA